MTDKPRLLEIVKARLRDDRQTLERRQRDVQAGATHEESRSEHAKDTRATEQSYLARGLAERVAEVQRTIDAVETLVLDAFGPGDAIAVGALVSITAETAGSAEDGGTVSEEREYWFILPGAGGLEITDAGRTIRTVSPVAPLGRALLGRSVGDESQITRPRGNREFEILDVC